MLWIHTEDGDGQDQPELCERHLHGWENQWKKQMAFLCDTDIRLQDRVRYFSAFGFE